MWDWECAWRFVLPACYTRFPFVCLLFVLSKLCHLRTEPVAAPGTHRALTVDMLNKYLQIRGSCVRCARHVVGTPHICIANDVPQSVGAEHVELWKGGQRRRRVSETTKAAGRLARAVAPRRGLCPRGACARGERGTCACARGARGVCPRRAPRVLPGVSHRGARLYNRRQARSSAEQPGHASPTPGLTNVPDRVHLTATVSSGRHGGPALCPATATSAATLDAHTTRRGCRGHHRGKLPAHLSLPDRPRDTRPRLCRHREGLAPCDILRTVLWLLENMSCSQGGEQPGAAWN